MQAAVSGETPDKFGPKYSGLDLRIQTFLVPDFIESQEFTIQLAFSARGQQTQLDS